MRFGGCGGGGRTEANLGGRTQSRVGESEKQDEQNGSENVLFFVIQVM